jgi:5-methylcytosine-specific restriction endonuclease McrA
MLSLPHYTGKTALRIRARVQSTKRKYCIKVNTIPIVILDEQRGTKYCNSCENVLLLDNFYYDAKKRYDTRCKQCSNKKKIKNRTPQPDYKRQWNKDNSEKCLKHKLKYQAKIGKFFDLNSIEYGVALHCWARVVRKRDNHTCKICNSNENPVAHHILYKKQYPKLSLDIDNGVTMCRECHYDFHDLNGWK